MSTNSAKPVAKSLPKSDKATVTGILEAASVKDLIEFSEMIDGLIESKTEAEENALKAKVMEMVNTAGFNFSQLFGKAGRKGTKVAAKYRDPLNPANTWSGRGRQPTWLADALKAGGKLTEYEIKR